jgi:hypothetical protein
VIGASTIPKDSAAAARSRGAFIGWLRMVAWLGDDCLHRPLRSSFKP